MSEGCWRDEDEVKMSGSCKGDEDAADKGRDVDAVGWKGSCGMTHPR